MNDSIDFANTDSAASHGAKLTRYRKALIGARLLVTDKEIAPLIQHLSTHLEMLSEHTGHVIEAAKQSKDSELKALAKATAYTKIHLDSLNNLEHTTLKRLTDPEIQ